MRPAARPGFEGASQHLNNPRAIKAVPLHSSNLPKGGSMRNPVDESSYHTYVLRSWQERAGEASPWRFELLNPLSGEHWGFANLERLLTVLRERMVDTSGPGKTRDPSVQAE